MSVHEPDGKPLNTTDAVAAVQPGCVMVPTVGAAAAVFGAASPVPALLEQPSTVVVTV